MNTTNLLWLAALWAVYGLIHSLLASLTLKRLVARHWPGLMPVYRLGFNLVAVILLIPPMWLAWKTGGAPVLVWGDFQWLAWTLSALAAAGFLWTLGDYDGAEFLGLRQWRAQEKRVEDQENFHLSPLHRFVRHPWYFLGLVLVWARDLNTAEIVTAAMITAYFVIGSRLEERKLLVYHGEVYRRYMAAVPGIFPLPWRWLSRAEADALTGKHPQPPGN
jgi:protein-S-isoprenylcysteine O-methyltransferase Ste14